MAIPKSILQFSIANAGGRFDFEGFEIPSSLESLGPDNMTVLHQFPGGKRVIQSFGVVPRPVEWHGIVMGPGSFARIQKLQALVGPLNATLTYGPYSYSGVFKSLKITPGFEGYIPYHATFEPTADLSANATPAQQSLGQGAAVTAAIADGMQAADAALVASTNLAVINLANGMIGTLNAVGTAITYAGNVSATAQMAKAQFTYLATDGNMNDAVLVLAMYQQSAILSSALAAVTAPNYTMITVDSPNLFLLAARYYNDSTQAVAISVANNDCPFFQTGLQTLIIPLST